MRLLIVEDSQKLREALLSGFSAFGWAVDSAVDGAAARPFLAQWDYDVVVLDLMMPRVDGLQLLREIRQQGKPVRVLVLSARDQIADRVQALDMGADDYLVKPFSFDELRARVAALTRRRHDEHEPEIVLGDLRILTAARSVHGQSGVVALTPKEYAILEFLARHRGRVFNRTALFEHLYGSASSASDKVIEVLMSTLRSKLTDAGCADPITTRRGFGYVVEV